MIDKNVYKGVDEGQQSTEQSQDDDGQESLGGIWHKEAVAKDAAHVVSSIERAKEDGEAASVPIIGCPFLQLHQNTFNSITGPHRHPWSFRRLVPFLLFETPFLFLPPFLFVSYGLICPRWGSFKMLLFAPLLAEWIAAA
jgi:hypothetical protein